MPSPAAALTRPIAGTSTTETLTWAGSGVRVRRANVRAPRGHRWRGFEIRERRPAERLSPRAIFSRSNAFEIAPSRSPIRLVAPVQTRPPTLIAESSTFDPGMLILRQKDCRLRGSMKRDSNRWSPSFEGRRASGPAVRIS